MPDQHSVLSIYGEMASSKSVLDAQLVFKHAIYDCVPMLQEKELQERMGSADNPMSTLDKLFGPMEIDSLGDQALTFMGLVSADEPDDDDDKDADDTGIDTVKK